MDAKQAAKIVSDKYNDFHPTYAVPWKKNSIIIGGTDSKNDGPITYVVTDRSEVLPFLISTNEDEFFKMANKEFIKF